VNWSLSDEVQRVEVRVGLAPGADVPRALACLRRLALETEHVLRDPPPEAWFLGFGERALELELRAYSPDVAHMLPIRHALHLAIERAFREEGIELGLPPRDLAARGLPAPATTGSATRQGG
jgi:potassium efflux system protein